MEQFYGMIPTGFGVGLIVGLVGVGGGSLMTPILVLFFGLKPGIAVGTDLLFASITKGVGTWVHHDKHQSVEWPIVLRLCCGSIPSSLLTLFVIHTLALPSETMTRSIQMALAFALLLTSLALLSGSWLKNAVLQWSNRVGHDPAPGWTYISGIMLGILVTLTSIGAGALGTVALLLLYPHLEIKKIVGTDLAHAIPLTAIAGLGHAGLGNIDYPVLGSLLIGSVPGIYLGSKWSGHLPEQALKILLALMLSVIAFKFLK